MNIQRTCVVILCAFYLMGCGVKSNPLVGMGAPSGDPGTPAIPSPPPEGMPQGVINTNYPQISNLDVGEARLESSHFKAVSSSSSIQSHSAQSVHYKYENSFKKQASTRLNNGELP